MHFEAARAALSAAEAAGARCRDRNIPARFLGPPFPRRRSHGAGRRGRRTEHALWGRTGLPGRRPTGRDRSGRGQRRCSQRSKPRGRRSMPTYLSPGVYMEEVESGSRPIEGVGTAVAAFVGLAARGPTNEPTLVTNWSQFTQTFGEFVENSYLA